MNSFHPAAVRRALTITGLALVILPASLASNAARAQDSTFLACARFDDRGQRIACLEDALDAALSTQDSAQETESPPAAEISVAPAAPAQNPVAASPAQVPAEEAEPEERSSLLDRIRSFGQREDSASISTDANGAERLHDTISALEKRNEMWIVTLSTGQVWRQAYPRSLNLRVGDDISIYQDGIGNGFRLATPRLSGFIRVERVR